MALRAGIESGTGEAAALGRTMPAAELTRTLAAEGLAQLARLAATTHI